MVPEFTDPDREIDAFEQMLDDQRAEAFARVTAAANKAYFSPAYPGTKFRITQDQVQCVIEAYLEEYWPHLLGEIGNQFDKQP